MERIPLLNEKMNGGAVLPVEELVVYIPEHASNVMFKDGYFYDLKGILQF